nr:helix-turn-helix domain-containing protein [Mycobacterium riyadhense]
MLRLFFTANDFASTHFLAQPAPALEIKFAARALRQGISTPWGARWRCSALAASPTSSASVRTLTGPFTWSISPTVIADDLDESLEAVLRLSARQLRAELKQFRSCPYVGVPPFLRYALEGDRQATLSLCRGTRNLFTAVVEPHWPDIRANHRSERVRRSRLVADRGLRTALTATVPGSRWSGDCLEIDTPQERTVRLAGRGVVLTPVVFWTGPPLVGDLGDHPVVLAYPAPAELTFRVGSESDTLAAILGSTRAAVLRLLADEHTTGDVARTLGISPASASEHTAALRAARLVNSRRDGKAVVHHATGLGVDLLDANRRQPGVRFRPSPKRLHNAIAKSQSRR